MVSPVLVKGAIPSDVIKHYESIEYCFEQAVIRNTTGAAIEGKEIAGQPVVVAAGVATLVEAGGTGNGEGDTNGIIAHRAQISLANNANTESKYTILTSGPAVVWEKGIPDEDVAGGALNKTTIGTALAGLNPPIDVAQGGAALFVQQTT